MTVNNCQSRGVTEPQREGGPLAVEGESESLLFYRLRFLMQSFTQAPSPDFVGSSLPEGASR